MNIIDLYNVSNDFIDTAFFLETRHHLYPDLFDFIVEVAQSDKSGFKELFTKGSYHHIKDFPDLSQGLRYFIKINELFAQLLEDIQKSSLNFISYSVSAESDKFKGDFVYSGVHYAFTNYDQYSVEFLKKLFAKELSRTEHQIFAKGKPRSWTFLFKPVNDLTDLKIIYDTHLYSHLFYEGVTPIYVRC